MALTSKPQPITVFDKNITPEFATYVLRLMAKDAKDRPDNMKDVMMEIKTQRIFYNAPQPPAETDESKSTAKKEE